MMKFIQKKKKKEKKRTNDESLGLKIGWFFWMRKRGGLVVYCASFLAFPIVACLSTCYAICLGSSFYFILTLFAIKKRNCKLHCNVLYASHLPWNNVSPSISYTYSS